ncbi:E3 ubiquitin-protein ligase ATL6-like [Panicum virgatum]|uniref:RING-type E3 ubiquitin transferase n=1 Tax=Panicum virgatum TaxID=38727 RepID=A0A8T0WK05_PANVG|nr:E3 ubiquitin-protein ligase ATL6-like [Panicum virgatum]KAG2649951.1 hypothetical protein PVAP13_1NG144800 [Panicum virgatum]
MRTPSPLERADPRPPAMPINFFPPRTRQHSSATHEWQASASEQECTSRSLLDGASFFLVIIMPTLLSARSRPTSGVGGGAGPGNRACYAIAGCAVALLLFCALAASVSVWMAFAFGGLALVAFAVAGCVESGGARVGPSAAESEAEAAAVDAARARRRFGMPKAAIDALPTFAYTPEGADQGGDGGGDLESGAAAGGEQCPVCLEDVEAGEMVRQLPACKHLFHVGCIDMWLESHRTCPVCRCNLLRSQRKVAAVKAAAAAAAAAEEEQPAEDALPPV